MNMMEEIKGYIHVHSNYSFDGINSITELASFFRKKGYRFICLTEHTDDFDEFKMDSLVKECRQNSDNRFTVVPGLEYRCNDSVHILGLAVTRLSFSDQPIEVVRHIKKNGGIAVIAHPRGYQSNLTQELLNNVDGAEVWSGQKDSRFFPHWETLQTFKRLSKMNPSLVGFGGGDLHSIKNYFRLDVMIKTDSKSFEPLILKGGASLIRGRYWTVSLKPHLSYRTIVPLKICRGMLNLGKRLMSRNVGVLF